MKMGALEVTLVTLNNNISFMGKTWWVVTVTLRLSSLLFSGFTLFYNEQDHFVCNTIQPGCANVCLDVFSPLSLFHFWLLQLLLFSLSPLLFLTYVTHRVLSSRSGPAPRCSSEGSHTSSLSSLRRTPSGDTPPSVALPRIPPSDWSWASYPCASFLDSLARVLLEGAFVSAQLYVYGLSVPRSFLCYEAPCVSGVACYTSRPTEKTLMLFFMLGVASLCFLLGLMDLACSLRRLAWRRRRKNEMLRKEEELSRGEQNSVFMGNGVLEDTEVLLSKRAPNGTLRRGSDDHVTPPADGDPANAVVPRSPRNHLVNVGRASTTRGRAPREGRRGSAAFGGGLGCGRYVLHDDTPSSTPQRDRREMPGPGRDVMTVTTPAGSRKLETGSRKLARYASMGGTRENHCSDSSGNQDKRAYV